MVEGEQNVRCVESGSIFLETANLREVEEKFSSGAVFKYEKQLRVTLERIVHFDDKRVSNVFQDSSFGHGVLDLVSSDYLGLLQNLKSIQLSCVFFLDKHHFTIGSFAEHGNHFKVLFRNIAACPRLLFSNNCFILFFNLFLLLSRQFLSDLLLDLLVILHILVLLLSHWL